MNTLSELDAGCSVTTHSATSAAVSSPQHEASSQLTAPSSRPVLLFEIPPDDREFFTKQLGHEVQREIKRTLNFLRVMHASGKPEPTAKRLADQLARTEGTVKDGKLLPPRGMTWKSLIRKYYDYIREEGTTRTEGGREVHYEKGDWRMFWDKAKWPVAKTGVIRHNSDSALAPAFIQFVRSNYERNQRGKFATFHAELIHLVRTRHALNDLELTDCGKMIKAGRKVPYIPGYSEWPTINPETGMPDGWTLSNLQKKIQPDKLERALVTVGRAAAKNFSLKVRTTRVGALLLQDVFADDHEFNQKIIVPRQMEFLRPRGFFIVDFLAAFACRRFFKPTFWDDELQKKKALTELDFLHTAISFLTKIGHRTDEHGTTMTGEHGLTILRDPYKTRLFEATGGKFRFVTGGRNNERGHVGQLHPVDHTDPNWRNKGRGNPRSKALIESGFSPIDNAFASLPGQTGLSRDVCPEQLPAIEEETRKLLEIAEHLAPELVEQLIFPQLTWFEWASRAADLFTFISRRRDHKIEGWEKCGFIHRQPPFEYMSREEAFLSQYERDFKAGLIKRLSLHEVPAILGPENCYRFNGDDTVGVTSHGEFEIDAKEWTMDSDPVRFIAVDYQGNRLKIGSRWRAYLNPSDLSVLILTDEDNRPIAECPRNQTAARRDLEAVKRLQGQAAHYFARATREADERHIAAGAAIAHRHEHNANVIAGRSLRAADHEQAALERRNERRAANEPDDLSAFDGASALPPATAPGPSLDEYQD